MKNLFIECDNNFTEVQTALSVLWDTGSKSRQSASHKIFYEEKKEIIWNPSNFDHDFLKVTYGQLSLMKSKMEQQILAITNALKARNNNSINFKLDYSKILPCKENSIEEQIQKRFMKAFELIRLKGKEKDEESQYRHTGAIKKKRFNSKDDSTSSTNPSSTQETEMDMYQSSPSSSPRMASKNEEENKDLLERWVEEKKKAINKRQLCLFCCKSRHIGSTAITHAETCTVTMAVCFNCGKDGHVSMACLKKHSWKRKNLGNVMKTTF